MNIKKFIGKKIRFEREKRGLSREQLCGSQEELTVRQLIRIELGQSLPSIVKIEFIAKVLEIDIGILLRGYSVGIPKEYFAKKYQLFKFPSYGNSDRLLQKVQVIEDIYEKYYDILPEEEIFTLELMHNFLDYILTGKFKDTEEIFEDYFQQLLIKSNYSLDDLLLVKYYAIQHQNTNYDEESMRVLEEKTISQKVSGDEYYNTELLGALTAIAGVYLDHAIYAKLKKIVDRMSEIIAETQQYSAKPLVLAYTAKYCLYEENNIEKARKYYDLAILLSQNFGDEILEVNLRKEKEADEL